jgi:DNA-binding MarR family transcriptional regulator
MRYRTFIVVSSRTIDHGNAGLSIANSTPPFTEKQGQYLAFIHTYLQLNGRPPAEADMEKFFGVTPPSVHRMVVELERRGLIRRVPRQPRSIELCVSADAIPPLVRQSIKTTASRY